MSLRDLKILFLFLGLAGLAAILPACNGNPPVVGSPQVTAVATYTSTPCGAPATFGDTTVETNNSVNSGSAFANLYYFNGGYIDSFLLYTSGAGQFRMAFYADDGSMTTPTNLLVQSAAVSTVADPGWNQAPIQSHYLAAGYYWMALQTEATVTTYYNSNGTALPYVSQSFNVFPASFAGFTPCLCSVVSMAAIYCP